MIPRITVIASNHWTSIVLFTTCRTYPNLIAFSILRTIFAYTEIYDCKGPNLTKIAINDEMNDLLLMMASPSEKLTFTGNCCLTIFAGFGLMGCMRGLPGPGPALGGNDDVG